MRSCSRIYEINKNKIKNIITCIIGQEFYIKITKELYSCMYKMQVIKELIPQGERAWLF